MSFTGVAMFLVQMFVSTLNFLINPFTVCVLLMILTYVYYKYKRTFSFWPSKNIPGPAGTFPLGTHSHIKNESHLIVYKRWIDKYGKLFGVYDILQPKLIVADADLVKKMLIEDFSSLMNRRKEFFDHPMEKKYSFVQEGDDWRETRSVFTSSFTSMKLKSMFEQMNICSDKLLHHIDQLTAANQATIINPMNLFSKYTSDTISRCVFSESFIASYTDKEDKILDSLLSYWLGASQSRIIVSLLLPEWLKRMIHFSTYNMSGLKYAWSLFTSIVHDRKQLLTQQKQLPTDILKQMMECACKVHWQEDDILANLLVIYTAGSHTSTVTLTHCSYILAKYPRIYRAIVQEYNDLINSGKQLTLQTVSHDFKYLDSVVSEVLRLLPPSTYNERRVSVESYTFQYNEQEITLHKDDIVYFATFFIHRNSTYWVNGDEFDETRFLPDNKHLLHPYAYLPFGHGPRNCIGSRFALTQIKLALLKLISRYTFSLVDETFDLLEDLSDTDDELIITKPFQLIVRPVVSTKSSDQ